MYIGQLAPAYDLVPGDASRPRIAHEAAGMEVYDAASRPGPFKRVGSVVVDLSPPYLDTAARRVNTGTIKPTRVQVHNTRGAAPPKQGVPPTVRTGSDTWAPTRAYLLPV